MYMKGDEIMQLTKNADALYSLFCKSYKSKIKDGLSIDKSKQLGDIFSIKEEYMPLWGIEDAAFVCEELKNASLITYRELDGGFYNAELTSHGISYMESKFKRGFDEILEYAEKIKNVFNPL